MRTENYENLTLLSCCCCCCCFCCCCCCVSSFLPSSRCKSSCSLAPGQRPLKARAHARAHGHRNPPAAAAVAHGAAGAHGSDARRLATPGWRPWRIWVNFGVISIYLSIYIYMYTYTYNGSMVHYWYSTLPILTWFIWMCLTFLFSHLILEHRIVEGNVSGKASWGRVDQNGNVCLFLLVGT